MTNIYNSTMTYETVRAELKRVLTPQERIIYRGITKSAMTSMKFDELFGTNMAEELIIAELYGRQAIPSDDPNNLYLVSSGHGLVARYNSQYFASMYESEEEQARLAAFVPNQTLGEMHNEYRNQQRANTPEDQAFVAANLDGVATEFVSWWNDLITSQPKSLGCS